MSAGPTDVRCATCGTRAAVLQAHHLETGEQWPICGTCWAQARRYSVPIDCTELPAQEAEPEHSDGIAKLVADLDRLGVRLQGNGGRLRTDAPPDALDDEMVARIIAHYDELVATVTARRTGHTWCPCDTCGESVLLDPKPRLAGKLVWPDCRLTPGCPGRHRLPEPKQ